MIDEVDSVNSGSHENLHLWDMARSEGARGRLYSLFNRVRFVANHIRPLVLLEAPWLDK